MRRAVVILLLLLLPMQIVWAGMDSYWTREQATGAQHQGHHVHDGAQAQEQAQEQAQGDAVQAAGADAVDEDIGCDYCHHSFCHILGLRLQFGGSPGRLERPVANLARYQSFIGDITHPPDI